jgi:FixJ family two-component response regulator
MLPPLTLREREVMTLWPNGKVTVKVHRGQVMRKMRAKSLAELVHVADKLGNFVPKA